MVCVGTSGLAHALKTVLMPNTRTSLEAHSEILICDTLRWSTVENPVEIRTWSKADDWLIR
jgi:hypothetical protein